jgi:hypothetical protein
MTVLKGGDSLLEKTDFGRVKRVGLKRRISGFLIIMYTLFPESAHLNPNKHIGGGF